MSDISKWPWPEGYKVRRILSEGEGGVVGLATCGAGSWVALKLLRLAPGVDPADALARHQRLQALTSGPGLLPMNACGLTADHAWLWEELLLASELNTPPSAAEVSEQDYQPATLRAELVGQGRFSAQTTVAIGLVLCEALSTLHAAGLVHRDVKTGNLLRVNGEVVLGDYGLTAEPGAPFDFRGTEGYIPTEGTADPAADLFALGKTLYELWTGCDRLEFPTLPLAVLNGRDWRQRGRLLNELLLKACSPSSRERFQSAEEFAVALHEVVRGRQPLLTHRRWVALAAAAVLVAGGGGWALLRSTLAPAAGGVPLSAPGGGNRSGPPSREPAETMLAARALHEATLLPDGRVLVTGGEGTSKSHLDSVEVFHPWSNTWTGALPMAAARREHTATLLDNGNVLVAGGLADTGAVRVCELHDPVTGRWTPTGSLQFGRFGHTATKLRDGKVLVAAGCGTATAEVYDPATGQWSARGVLGSGRCHHDATLLPDGRVLVTGGYHNTGHLDSTEMYNPLTGVWSAAPPMRSPRSGHAATLLQNGQVLVSGGVSNAVAPLRTAELYDPEADRWVAVGSMRTNRAVHAATLLSNGEVLVSGGSTLGNYALRECEVFSPGSGQWRSVAAMRYDRRWGTATLLRDGRVLAVGGSGTARLGFQPAEVIGVAPTWRAAAGTAPSIHQK